ncbi:MAG: hypothetical protein IPO60_08340, partial [Flavobacteriales bacterium]|nr:hypothetical protein [Flavobacteriales bacterium]
MKQIVADLFGRLKNGDVLVLSGSLPKGLPSDTYAGIIKRSNKAGVMTILDAEGEVLRLGMAEHPTIAKPNQAEFGTLFPNADARSSGQWASSLMKALGDTKGSIFLSLGSKGVAVVKAGEQTLWRGQVSIKGSQRLGEDIGSGYSMVGALAVGLQQ